MGLILPSVAAAGGCKFETDEIDQFTGNVRQVTKPVVLAKKLTGEAPPGKALVSARRDGDDIRIEFRLTMGAFSLSTQVTADPDAKHVIVLLEGGGQVELISVSDEVPQVKPRYGGMAIEELWTVPPTATAQLLDSPATAIRYQGAFHRFDADLTGKGATVLSSALACLSE